MSNRKIVVANDGNIPSIWAHSVFIANIAEGYNSLGEFDVELVTVLSWINIKHSIKYGNIHNFYDISKNIKIKRIPTYNYDFFRRSHTLKGFAEKIVKYIKIIDPI